MSNKRDKLTVGLAEFFSELCSNDIFKQEFLDELARKEGLLVKILKSSSDSIEINRSQGALKLMDDIYFWLDRHQINCNKTIGREIYVRSRKHTGNKPTN